MNFLTKIVAAMHQMVRHGLPIDEAFPQLVYHLVKDRVRLLDELTRVTERNPLPLSFQKG